MQFFIKIEILNEYIFLKKIVFFVFVSKEIPSKKVSAF